MLVRRACTVNHRPATSRMIAAGISHEICPPNSFRKSRFHPVSPHRDPAAPIPPTLPVSLPVRRPNPL